MKKLFALLLFLIVPLAQVGAQALHGRILIVHDTSSYVPHDLEHVVPTIYSGMIDSMVFLPNDLSIYDAVLLKTDPPNGFYSRGQTDTLSFSDQLTLIDYLKKGGKLYDEAQSFFLSNFNFPNDTNDNPLDTLAHYLGLEEEGSDQLTDSYDDFFGVDSEFTRGFNIPHTPPPPTGYDVAGTYYPFGNFIPVLFGEEVDPVGDIFAWIPPDTSIHAVMHHALDFEYYAPFLTRVLCDYFGLCEDAVKEAPQAVPTATLRVMNDGVSTSLIVLSEESGMIDIENALGITVYHISVNPNTNRVALPESLPNGVYFARLQTEHGGQVQPFAIVAK